MNHSTFSKLKEAADVILKISSDSNAVTLANFIKGCQSLTINKRHVSYTVISHPEDIDNLHRDLFESPHK